MSNIFTSKTHWWSPFFTKAAGLEIIPAISLKETLLKTMYLTKIYIELLTLKVIYTV